MLAISFLVSRRTPRTTLFPYTTLFRSRTMTFATEPSTVRFPASVLTTAGNLTVRSEEHTSELQSRRDLVCRLLLEKKILLLISKHLILCIYLIFRILA